MSVKQEKPSIAPGGTTTIHLLTRQPLTALGKTAFWTSFVSFLSGLGGTIALAITNGAPSRDIVITTALSLLITLLIASRMRWLQAIGVLFSIANLYVIFTEPFVVESLAAPKGPNGGYGHFIGDDRAAM